MDSKASSPPQSTTEEDEGSPPLLNRKVLRRQADDLGESDLDGPITKRLVRGFVENAENLLPKLKQDATQGCLDTVADAAHQLKGGARIVGCEAFASKCARLEQATRRGDQEEVEEIVGHLPSLFEKTRSALKEAIGESAE